MRLAFFIYQDIVLDVLGNMGEHFGYINSLLGTGLVEGDIQTLGQSLCLLVTNLSLLFQVTLVADQNFTYSLVGVVFDLFHPSLDIVEGVSVGDRVGQNDAHGSFVVGLCDSLETFLARRVPDLHLYFLAFHFQSFYFEVDADGSEMAGSELTLAESKQNVSLSHCGVSNDE